MVTHDLGVLRRYKPVDPCTRITRSQLHQHRNGMHHVAKRRWLDQQNARELSGLEFRLRVPYRCVFDLVLQFAKDKSTRVTLLVKSGGVTTIVNFSPLPLRKEKQPFKRTRRHA